MAKGAGIPARNPADRPRDDFDRNPGPVDDYGRPIDPPAPDPEPPPEAPYVPTPGQFALLKTLLTRYGLMALYDRAVEWMIDGTADSPERLELALRETQEFQDRFKGLFAREAAGRPPISVDEYLAWEDQATQLMRAYGYPPGFYDDPDDFAEMIGVDISVTELEQRLASYADIAAVGREQVREQLSRHAVGSEFVDSMTDGELASWFIDPQRAVPAIRQRLGAAQVSAAAADSGFGGLSFDEASRLTGTGLDEGQARQAFGALAAQGDVVGALAGESEGLDRDTQLGVVAGDAAANEALERRRRQRQGAFSGGGRFASGQEGVSGLGRA